MHSIPMDISIQIVLVAVVFLVVTKVVTVLRKWDEKRYAKFKQQMKDDGLDENGEDL